MGLVQSCIKYACWKETFKKEKNRGEQVGREVGKQSHGLSTVMHQECMLKETNKFVLTYHTDYVIIKVLYLETDYCISACIH